MKETIKITDSAHGVTTIDIEGVIGLPEKEQFAGQTARVATYEKFRARIEALRGIASPRVVVNIRSTGGDVNDALLIHDALRELSAEITTRCYGYVASAATIIAQAASPGRREISANALYLIHKSTAAGEGNTNSLTQTVDLLGKTDARIAAVYATASGRPDEEFAVLMNENDGAGRWLSPREALDAGLADRIVEAAPIANSAARLVEALRLPALPENTVQNPKQMKIAKRWNSILEILGLSPEREETLTENRVEALNDELDRRAEAIAGLRNAITELEASNAQLAAKATSTQSKEDPSATEYIPTENQSAYALDAKNFNL